MMMGLSISGSQLKASKSLTKASSAFEKCKILCVTHGGLITEYMNYVDSFKPEKGPSRPNKAKNCSIFIFHIKPCATNPNGFSIENIVENEVSHLKGGGEDRILGKGNG